MVGNVRNRTKVISQELCFIIDERENKFPESSSFFPSLAPLDDIAMF